MSQQQITGGQGSASNQEIAHQWIDYLKRKNATLTMVWVVLLIVALATSAAAAFFFLKGLERKEALQIEQKNSSQLMQNISSLETKIEKQVAQSKILMTSLEEAQAELGSLKNYQGEADSQINLSNRLVSVQKQKIASLEKEISLLEEALVASETNSKKLQDNAGKHKQRLSALEQMHTSRKTAYDALAKRQVETQEEMQRLAGELNKAQEREASLDARNASLSKELKDIKAKLTLAEKGQLEAQNRLKALTSPIVPSRVPKAIKKAEPKKPEPRVSSSTPIKTPQTSEVTPESSESNSKEQSKKAPKPSSPLDFGQISID